MTTANALENYFIDKALRAANFTNQFQYLALHTADPGETGTNEVVGGSYARQAVTFNASSGGVATNNGIVAFTGMPSVPSPGVVAFSLWDAASSGNCGYTGWLGNSGELFKPFTMADTATDLIVAPAHGYSNDDVVVIITEIGNTTIPTGLTAGVLYFVVSSLTDSFQLSATKAGAAINLTGKGSGLIRRVVPKVINPGDTFQVPNGNLSVTQY